MKILVVCQHFYPEQFRINDICFELVKRSHDVTVLTGLPNYPKGKVLKEYKWFKKRNEIINGIKVKRVSLFGRGNSLLMMILNYMSFAILSSLKAFFMKKDYDLVYVFQLSPITMTWPAIIVKKMKKIPLIIHCLDQWPISITTGGISKKSLVYKILYNWSKIAYNAADLITISSKSFENYFKDELKIDKNEKGLIYCPSYAESIYQNVITTNNSIFDIVFAGNVGPAQSVETIIEAANSLKHEKEIIFHIVGDGLSKNNCMELAKKHDLSNVLFYNHCSVEEVKKYYELADAFIITMVDNEVVNSTLPAKVQSYMAAGKPIIGAISGEVKSVIEDSNCGLCCEPLDDKALARNILEMKNNKEKMILWSKNSKKYYMNNFQKEKSLDQMESIFKDTIKKR